MTEQQEQREERVKVARTFLAAHPQPGTSAQSALEDLCLLLVEDGEDLNYVFRTALDVIRVDYGIGEGDEEV